MTIQLPKPKQASILAANPEFRIRENEQQISWDLLFNNSNPVEVEIGCGKGRFIINSALANPEINYIGIERALRYFRIMKERVCRRNLNNIRLLRDDAVFFTEKYIPNNAVAAYHIYFPDPWPKKRHRKRRLFNTQFLKQIQRTISKDGTIDFATDYAEYYDEIITLITASNYLTFLPQRPKRVKELGSDLTNFETKYTAEGRTIYRATYTNS